MLLRVLLNSGKVVELNNVAQVLALSDFDDPLMVGGEMSPGVFVLSRPDEPDFADACRALGLQPPEITKS